MVSRLILSRSLSYIKDNRKFNNHFTLTLTMPLTFEFISIGNELLTGRTLNTNSQWLAQEITSLGGYVRRIITVRDDIDEIASALIDSLRRKTHWIILSGGLGPTYDDKTLEGVSRALNRELEINPKALEMVKEKYEGKAELTEARIKMAKLPKDSEPLKNSVGTAPGVLLMYKRSKIVCLPGVPAELKAIFEEEVKPLILKEMKRKYSVIVTLEIYELMESSLAPILDEVVKENPDVYIKSHPKGKEVGAPKIELDINVIHEDEKEARKRAMELAHRLKEKIIEKGGKVLKS